jgi:cation diffusion facilitator family transporter
MGMDTQQALPRAARDETSKKEKKAAARSSVLAAVLLTGMKIVVGALTGSLGILAEAAHSGLDLIAAVMTLIAVSVSSKPADSTHSYGHGKVENLSAMLETALLLITCVWIVYEAVRRLFFHDVAVEASAWAFMVMGVSIVVDLSRSRILKRAAQKHHSQALEADALHFSTDVWSSSVVIVGLILVGLARTLHAPWLAKADAVAALGVSGIVVFISIQLGKKTIADLLDGVPATLREQVVQAARVPGVLAVGQARIRRSGPEMFVDLVLIVNRHEAFEHTHDISNAARDAVRQALKKPEADIVIHVAPGRDDDDDWVARIRSLAARHGLAAHEILIYEADGRPALELHLEIRDSVNVGAAHARATEFEEAVRREIPGLGPIVSHLEPVRSKAAADGADGVEEERVRRIIAELAPRMGLRCNPHDIELKTVGGEVLVSFHCTVDAATDLADAHSFTERFELALRRRAPRLGRVIIHIEPPEDGPAAA